MFEEHTLSLHTFYIYLATHTTSNCLAPCNKAAVSIVPILGAVSFHVALPWSGTQ